jgi:hypothetical protein
MANSNSSEHVEEMVIDALATNSHWLHVYAHLQSSYCDRVNGKCDSLTRIDVVPLLACLSTEKI